jgi:hypothetical protein
MSLDILKPNKKYVCFLLYTDNRFIFCRIVLENLNILKIFTGVCSASQVTHKKNPVWL